ncbi:MAG: hypothetical protein Q8N43_00985, partial [Candidatus Azambacteria bacterium]|nr:hypothetical protein [Candidatus Azambacteria bacterium]
RSVEDGVKAGRYNWSDSDITSSHFPSEEAGTKKISIELVHFGRSIRTKEVLSELDKTGLRSATLKEFLALGEKEQDIQREIPSTALVCVWKYSSGRRYCACLRRSDSKRNLSLSGIGYRWDDCYRFAAVRK